MELLHLEYLRPIAEPNIVWGGDTPTLPLTNLFCDLDFAPVNYDDDDIYIMMQCV